MSLSSTLRTLDELVVPEKDDAISLIKDWIVKGEKSLRFHEQCNEDDEENYYPGVKHRLLLVNVNTNGSSSSKSEFADKNSLQDGAKELLKLQVTTRSPMGAFAFHCRVLFAYNGMIRVLGCGQNVYENAESDALSFKESPTMRSISSWTNHCHKSGFLPRGCVIVADDIFGGVFALNGGGLKNCELGKVCYLSPDSIDSTDWEDLGLSYTAWFSEWVMDAQRVFLFYSSWIVKDFFDVIKEEPHHNFNERIDRCFSFYPPLWSKEAGTADISLLSRTVVPVDEMWAFRHAPFVNSIADQREKEERAREASEAKKKIELIHKELEEGKEHVVIGTVPPPQSSVGSSTGRSRVIVQDDDDHDNVE